MSQHKQRKRRHQQPATQNNRLLLIGSGVLALVAIALGVWVWASMGGEESGGTLGPRLAVNQERIDLGKQPFDRTVRAEFTLQNTGDRSLTIDASTPVRVLEGC